MSKDPENRERTWEVVQKKAFTAWVNSYLERKHLKIEDLQKDFATGVNLINFLEVLVNKNVKNRYDANPTNRVKMVENVHIALMFLQSETPIKLVSIGVEDFVDCNLKLILGFLWTLFRKFRSELAAEATGVEKSKEKEALLHWVQQTISDVAGAPSRVDDFKASFADGMVFLALIHKFDSAAVASLMPFKDQTSLENLTTAFDLAEKHLGVPKLVDPQDLLDGTVDERAMHLYVSLYFHAFASAEEKRRLEQEKARLAGQLQDMQSDRANTEAARKELERKNQELAEKEASLKENVAAKSNRIQELEEELARNKADIERKRNELAEYNQERDAQLQQLAKDVAELKHKIVQGANHGKGGVEDKDAFLQEKLKEIEGDAATPSEEVGEHIKGAEDTLGSVVAARQEAQKEFDTTKHHLEGEVKKLDDAHADITAKRTHLRNQFDDLKRKQALELNGLSILRTNLQDHLNDLVKWRPYLNQEKEEEGVSLPHVDFNFTDKAFEEQLTLMAKETETSNAKLEDMVKEKEAAKAEEAALRQQKE